MKHAATLQLEFSKQANNPSWWEKLTFDEQMDYLQKHRGSKLRPKSKELDPKVKQALKNRIKYQGGLSDLIAKTETYKKYVSQDHPGGYFSGAGRRPALDKYVEERLRSLGLESESAADWLTSTSARHMMNDMPILRTPTDLGKQQKRVDEYTKDAFIDSLIWNHPDHDGSMGSVIKLKEKIENYARQLANEKGLSKGVK